MKIRFLVLCIVALSCSPTYAQEVNKKETTSTVLSSSFLDRTEFKVGLTGTIFWRNGVSVGIEYLWKEYKKNKFKRGSARTNTHQFLWNGNLGFTTNLASKTETGAFMNYGITWRRTNKKGKQFSIELNPLGYYRSFLPETYEVRGDQVDKVFLPGRGYYSPSLSVGLGKQRKGKVHSGSYFNVVFSPRFNYNAGTLPTFSLQYGWRFNFKKKKK
ncbi:hypothetical protein [Spongiimicrobium salis]|uniref:hypothetical protein n=1 Tax=Spongiimicrobium salis TaxID=1667022 RepID=UPI00374D5A45